jgi:hypothetical protein
VAGENGRSGKADSGSDGGVTKAVFLAQSGEGGSPLSGALLLYLAIMLVAAVVLFFVLHRETRTRRKARDASATSPVDEDRPT